MNNIFNINNYDVFIFDFDGTILDTEKYHYEAYVKAFKDFDINFEIDIQNYFKYLHNIDKSDFNELLKNHNIKLEDLYVKKSAYYKEFISKNFIDTIGNIESFLYKIKQRNKELIIVTNSSIQSLDLFLKKYPILGFFDKIYTKEDFTKKKPDPECYLKMQDIYKNKKLIGFEDSYQGFHALYQASDITPIHIANSEYYYNEYMKNNYSMTIIKDYNDFY